MRSTQDLTGKPDLAIYGRLSYREDVIFLSSTSPQRSLLLRRAGIAFTVVPHACDEATITAARPDVLALERARAKARSAEIPPQHRHQGGVVVGADTVVAVGTQILGKPADAADAKRMLGLLQGTTHSVYTGHACVLVGADGAIIGEAARIAVAQVTMRPLSAKEIDDYVASGESLDKAGAYAIQETGDRFVVDLKGGWDTVVGLNVGMTARVYHELTEQWPDGYKP